MNVEDEANLSIGDLAEATGVSSTTLRYYEDEGLIPMVERNGAGHRRYRHDHIRWLGLLDRLRTSGMSIARMRKYANLAVCGAETMEERGRLLRRHRDELNTIPRVRAYVVGSNRWVTGEAWSLPQTRRSVLYLSSGPGRGEAGRLLGQPPGPSSAANFVSDPAELRIREDPSFAENTVYPEGAANLADQLAFVSAPLETDLTVLGPVELELTVTVDNHDCALYGLLVSVAPDGTARALAQPGKVRCSFHLGRSLRAGESVPVTIPMFPIGYRLPAGTRLGLIVRGDWFPRFAPPDPGTGVPSPVTVSVRTGPATVNELRVWILNDR